VGGIVVNMIRSPLLTNEQLAEAKAGTLPAATLRASLVTAGLGAHVDQVLPGLLSEAADHAHRVDLERRERQRLDDLDLPIIELPFLSGGIDLGALYGLAQRLVDGRMA
jgi:hypothetical protein